MENVFEVIFGIVIFLLWVGGALIKFIANQRKTNDSAADASPWQSDGWASAASPQPPPQSAAAAPPPLPKPQHGGKQPPKMPARSAPTLHELQAKAISHMQAAAQQHQSAETDDHEHQSTQMPDACETTSAAYASEQYVAAFPNAASIALPPDADAKQQRGSRPPIIIRKRGIRSLRRAIIMSEVLGRPRAFDV